MATEHVTPAVPAHGAPTRAVEITVLIPAYNESDNLRPLLEKLAADLSSLGKPYEILVVDDGSTDDTLARLKDLQRTTAHLRAIVFRRNYGKSAALSVGFQEARGRYVVTMDADLQDDSKEIGALIAKIDEGFDLVSGWKQDRKDPIMKTLPSKLFNAVTSSLTGVRLHDMNCGLKAYRSEVTKSVRLRGEQHRFIPVLAHWNGFRVGEIRTVHHRRLHGKTKFGTARFLNGFLDLLAVMFLTTSSRRPLHLFGRIGVFLFLAGAAITIGFSWRWVLGEGLRLRPALLFGTVLVILGLQFVSIGFLGELIASTRVHEPDYAVRERL